uniref:LicD family protein n=1 Tax=Agathobacter sp. TaxID=2021311 RepID=UPI0040565614
MKKIDSLKEVQKIELDILLKFNKYCEAHNLNYVLCGGTLLGAVRHHGFIPWDDDIDILMPRPDYDKLLQLSRKKRIGEEIKVDGSYSYPFIKMMNMKTHIQRKGKSKLETNHIWIDVFPADGLPEDDALCKRKFICSLFLKRLTEMSTKKIGYGTTFLKRVLGIPILPIVRLIGCHRIVRWTDSFCRKLDYDKSKYVGCLCWGYGSQERMSKKEFFEERVKVVFEGYGFWAPKCWDYYLTQLYGDYMQLPPEEKRITHNMTAWIEE